MPRRVVRASTQRLPIDLALLSVVSLFFFWCANYAASTNSNFIDENSRSPFHAQIPLVRCKIQLCLSADLIVRTFKTGALLPFINRNFSSTYALNYLFLVRRAILRPRQKLKPSHSFVQCALRKFRRLAHISRSRLASSIAHGARKREREKMRQVARAFSFGVVALPRDGVALRETGNTSQTVECDIGIHNYIRIALLRCMYTKRLLDRLRLNGAGGERGGGGFTLNPPEKSAPRYITECCAYICLGRVFTMPILIDRDVEAAVYSSNRTGPATKVKRRNRRERDRLVRATNFACKRIGRAEWKYIIV